MKAFIIGFATVFIVVCIGLVCNILPTSPFLSYISWSGYSEYLPYINYFVPIDFYIVTGEGWLIALSAYIFLKFARKSIATVSDLMPLN